MEPDFDDTDLTPEEFERAMAEGVPCQVYVPSSRHLIYDWQTATITESRGNGGDR